MAQMNDLNKRRRWFRFRILLFLCIFFIATVAVFGRTYQLQVVQSRSLSRLAERQHQRSLTLQPTRGTIYDRKGQEMAVSLQMDSLFAEPQRLDVHSGKFKQLSRILKLDAGILRRKLRGGRHFVWLKRWATKQEAQKIKKLKMSGIGFVKESRRFYPHNRLAAHVIGFAGMDARGLEGIELQYEKFLRDEPLRFTVDRDAKGRIVMSNGIGEHSRRTSTRLYLTIDKKLQYLAEKELAQSVKNSGAKSGFIIAADPHTMEIRAMANYPSYNPNKFWEFNPSQWRNRVITDLVEPGSIFKVFLFASALDAGAVRMNDIFYCEKGAYEFFGRTIHDMRPHGWLSLGQILKYSSNIGAIKVGSTLGKERFYKYLRNFGFGSTTDIDFPGERAGILHPPGKWSRMAEGTISFGQGISVTGIQILTALCAIANDGVLMKPYVVSRVVDSNGRVLKENRPRVVRRVISPKSAAQMTRLMRTVVSRDGTGHRAMIAGYPVAGKTGTAQKVDPIARAYFEDKVVVAFVGFAPASNPRLAILVVIDEPEGRVYGGSVAAPVFRNVMKTALQDMGIHPEHAGERLTPSLKVAAAPAPRAMPHRGESLALKGKKDGAAAPSGGNGTMPDLRGKHMRDVLRWAQRTKVRINVVGSGWAVAQEPIPGKKVEQGQVCRVIFQQRFEQGTPR
ncbi:MAG: transpeptidase family protein [Deltaproteobacteria bacterium]|nr:transpeptidase family protein [Deltaproteobacteria bacterium]